jgi:uncharacterized membrane protein
LFLALLEGVGNASFKQATLQNGPGGWFMLGMFSYNALGLLFYHALYTGLLWKVNAYWDVFSHAVVLFIAFVLFKETATWRQLSGLVLALAGMFLMH